MSRQRSRPEQLVQLITLGPIEEPERTRRKQLGAFAGQVCAVLPRSNAKFSCVLREPKPDFLRIVLLAILGFKTTPVLLNALSPHVAPKQHRQAQYIAAHYRHIAVHHPLHKEKPHLVLHRC